MTRVLPLFFLAVLLTFPIGEVIGQVEQKPTGEVFSPETELKFHVLLVKLKEKRTKLSLDEIQLAINDMGKILNLTSDQKAKLADGAKPIVADYVDAWIKDTDSALRHSLAMGRGAQLSQLMLVSDQLAGNEILSSTRPPIEQDAWVQVVHGVLTADQTATWDKDRADKQLAEDQKFNGILDPAVKQFHEAETLKAQTFCHEVEDGFGLDQDHKDKLEDLAAKAVDQSTDQWRAGVKMLIKGISGGGVANGMSLPANFLPIVNSIKTEIGRDFSEGYDQQPVWKKNISDILTDAQLEKVKSFSDETIANRVKIMGLIFVEIMDQKVGLTAPQREQLTAISEGLVKDDAVLCPKLNADYNGSGFSPNYIYGLAKKATDDQLKPILDPIQLARWKGDEPSDQPQVQPNLTPPTDTNPPAPDMDKEPEHVEDVIGSKMYDDEVAERKLVLDTYSLKIENLNRILNPSPELAEKLRFTVLSLAEKQMFILKSSSEQQLRAQMIDVTPDNIDERLQTVANFINRFNMVRANGSGVSEFDGVVLSLLSKDQLDLLRKESDARADFSNEAECEVITDDFSRNFSLDDGQKKKFIALVQKVMKDYGDDIPNSVNAFMGGDNVPWYLSPNLEFLPVIGANEADLKAILTDDQLKQWHLSQEQGGAQNYWPQVEQFHQNRIQQGKVDQIKL